MEHGRIQTRSGKGNPGLSSTTVDIAKLEALYDEFPFIEQTEIRVPLVGSTGKGSSVYICSTNLLP